MLGASVHHLIQHHNRVFPGPNDKWKEPQGTFREKKVFPGIKGTKGGTKITLEQLLESQRKSSLQAQIESREESIPCVLGPIGRRYEMGQRVYYFIEELGNEKWHSARVLGWSNKVRMDTLVKAKSFDIACYRIKKKDRRTWS